MFLNLFFICYSYKLNLKKKSRKIFSRTESLRKFRFSNEKEKNLLNKILSSTIFFKLVNFDFFKIFWRRSLACTHLLSLKKFFIFLISTYTRALGEYHQARSVAP